MKIYCTDVQRYPPKLVDITELFFNELRNRGIVQRWFFQGADPGPCRSLNMRGVDVSVPARMACSGFFCRVANKLIYWICDIASLLRAAMGDVDLIQARDKHLAALAGLIIARIAGKRFTVWYSYPFPEHFLETSRSKRGLARLAWRLRSLISGLVIYRLVMPRADHVFVQSEQMKRDIAKLGVPLAKMTPVPMGIKKSMFDENSGSVPVVPGRIVYMGTLTRVRRLETVIGAMKIIASHFPEARLYMVGDGDIPSEKEFLIQEARRLGVEECVVFTGFLPVEEAWKVVRSAEVCLSPYYPTATLLSTSPTKLIEYMALGKPVVANDHPEQQLILQESGAGLCVDWSEQAFADAVAHLLTHPEEAMQMGMRGPSWVRQYRTYDRIADDVFIKYQQILGKG